MGVCIAVGLDGIEWKRDGESTSKKAIIRSLSSRVSSIALEANGKEFNNFYCFQKNDY